MCRAVVMFWLLGTVGSSACKGDPAPSPGDIADRGWHAHELAIAAGEREKTCAAAGPAMQRVIAEHRQAFVDAIALDNDREQLRAATEFIEAHADRYRDLETRMEGLSERCADEPTVVAAFRQMESP
jgi:hypothetical protein